MSGLVESLLTLTRMDELGQLNLEQHDLAELAEEVAKDARVANSKVSFEVISSGDLPKIEIDANRIKQVLTNLVANASRFAPDNSSVEIELAQSGENILISVVDHGEGIPELLREKVFDRFYRADTSRNRETGGSGLGLAIARSIVTAHSGRIWVDETENGGATFRFELPISQASK